MIKIFLPCCFHIHGNIQLVLILPSSLLLLLKIFKYFYIQTFNSLFRNLWTRLKENVVKRILWDIVEFHYLLSGIIQIHEIVLKFCIKILLIFHNRKSFVISSQRYRNQTFRAKLFSFPNSSMTDTNVYQS